MFDNTSFTEQLQTALDDTVREFNKSRDPDAAVAKVACDFGFTPSGAKRLVETFNRARTIFHFNTSDDKTAEFKLADPEQVAKLMYTPKTQVKEANVLDTIALQSYYEGQERDYAHSVDTLFSEKVAEAEPVLPVENLYARIRQQRNWFSKAAEAAKNLYDTATVYINHEAGKLASQMLLDAKDGERLRIKFAEYKEACRRDSELSPAVEKVAEHFAKVYRVNEPVSIKFASVMDTAGIDKYLVATAKISDYMQKQAIATAVAEGIEKDAAEFEQSIKTLFYHEKEAEDTDFLLKRGASVGSTSDKKPASDNPEQRPWLNIGESGGLLDTVSRGATFQAGKGMSGFMNADLFRATTGAPIERENKELTGTATNVHRQLMLEDLLANDPVLSAADPATVINAYQGLLNLAPDVANQRPTVVSILRQAIHAQDAYSPYDADQLVRLNAALKNVKGTSPTPEKKLEVRP